MKECDVLVIGSGLAGAMAALNCAEAGLDVLVVSNGDGATRWAQGGIVYKADADPSSLVEDINKAGAYINNQQAVNKVATEGPELVKKWLMEYLEVPFDKGNVLEAEGSHDQKFDLCLEAAHSEKRILHIHDQTGRGIHEKAQAKLKAHPKIKIFKGTLVDLLLNTRHDTNPQTIYNTPQVMGAYVFVSEDSSVVPIRSRSVILATGGYSRLYEHSTGPESSRGDGISAAQRAGARVLHMEYVQFHPTALYIPGHPRYLLTEALRGSGAKLLNFKNQSFVDELASRDVVARAIQHEILKSGSGSHVWLDLRGVKNLDHFTGVLEKLAEFNIDPSRELVPVVPAAHYTVGGVWTDVRGQTTLPGLYAAGEVACTGLHGANRLASTSLLECVVFGVAAAASAIENSKKTESAFSPAPWRPESEVADPVLIQQDRDQIAQTMWHYVGLIRSPKRLRRAESTLNQLRNEVESFYAQSQLSDALIGLRHSVLVANLVLYAAIRNRKSLGTHFLSEDT